MMSSMKPEAVSTRQGCKPKKNCFLLSFQPKLAPLTGCIQGCVD